MPTFVYSNQVGKPCRNMRIKYCILKDYFISNFSFNFFNPRHPTAPVVRKKTKYYTTYSICNPTFIPRRVLVSIHMQKDLTCDIRFQVKQHKVILVAFKYWNFVGYWLALLILTNPSFSFHTFIIKDDSSNSVRWSFLSNELKIHFYLSFERKKWYYKYLQ